MTVIIGCIHNIGSKANVCHRGHEGNGYSDEKVLVFPRNVESRGVPSCEQTTSSTIRGNKSK